MIANVLMAAVAALAVVLATRIGLPHWSGPPVFVLGYLFLRACWSE